MNSTVSSSPNWTCHGLKSIPFERTTAVLATAIGTSFVNFFTGVTAAIINPVILFAISTKRSLRTPSNLLLCSMCLTDFLVGFIVQMLYVVLRIHEIFDIHLCLVKQIYACAAHTCAGASLMTLTLVTMDRCFAITCPYRYDADRLFSRYVIAIIIVWVAWFTFSILPWVGAITPKAYYLSLSCIILISFFISVACYVVIFRIVRRHKKRILAETSTSRAPHEPASDAVQHVPRKAERKRSNAVALILAIFVICYLPKVLLFL